MDKITIINQIFEVCIFPLLAILTSYLVQIIKVKTSQIIEKQDNEIYNKYLGMLSDTITTCVIAVNQTYVDALKKKGEFTLEAQKQAFDMVYKQVLLNLTKEAEDYLKSFYADFDNYLINMIEAQVRMFKIDSKE